MQFLWVICDWHEHEVCFPSAFSPIHFLAGFSLWAQKQVRCQPWLQKVQFYVQWGGNLVGSKSLPHGTAGGWPRTAHNGGCDCTCFMATIYSKARVLPGSEEISPKRRGNLKVKWMSLEENSVHGDFPRGPVVWCGLFFMVGFGSFCLRPCPLHKGPWMHFSSLSTALWCPLMPHS